MTDPVQRALDSLADAVDVDWTALETAAAGDDAARATLQRLKDIAAVARGFGAPGAHHRRLPFRWSDLDVREAIAQGAHGDVYRAWDPKLAREVALKLQRQPDDPGDAVPLAIAEGRRLARVRHPNVVSIFGANSVDGLAGIWMELVDGSSLCAIVARDGPRQHDDACAIAIAVLGGLAAVHDAGLVHRDVKAQNVIRDRSGRIVLMDLSAGHDLRRATGAVHGTPLYLAPEMLDGRPASVASDIYSVGVLLFYLLTGRYPVEAATLDELRQSHRTGALDRALARADFPRGIAAVLSRALACSPHDRYGSAVEMRTAIAAAFAARVWRPSRRGFAAIALLALATSGALFVVAESHGSVDEAMATENAGAAQRKVRLPYYRMGRPSRDGEYFPYFDENGDLLVWRVRTGQSRPVAGARDLPGRGEAAMLSPTAHRIVFAAALPGGAYELHAVNVDGTWPRVVLRRQTAYEPIPLDWSRDGRQLLVWLKQRNGASELVLVPADGGDPRLLASLDAVQHVDGSISPDGRDVVFSTRDAAGASRLFSVDTSGRRLRTLLDDGTNPDAPRWLADGRRVFFVRDAQAPVGSTDGWTIEPAASGLAGEPQRVLADLGGVLALAVTEDDAVYRTVSNASSEVYVAPIDLSGSQAPGPPRRVQPQEIGNRAGPSWSADGRSLAYFRLRERLAGMTPIRELAIQDMITGAVKVIDVGLPFLGGYSPRWSPDGRHLVIWGRDGERMEDFGFFRVDVATGEILELVPIGTNMPAFAQYSPDGTHLVHVHPTRGLVSRDLATGREEVLVPSRGEVLGPLNLTRDGRSLAFARMAGDEDARVSTIEVQRGREAPQVLMRVKWPLWLTLHGWTPDGQHLLYSLARGTSAEASLHRLDVESGRSLDLRFTLMPTVNGISLSPDGRFLAYTERMLETELWVAPLLVR